MIPTLLFLMLLAATRDVGVSVAGTCGLFSVRLFHHAWRTRRAP